MAKNIVYIGQSLDGFIADKNGGLDWLDSIPNPDHDDMGYGAFMDQIDALVMGRTTFETVLGFDIEWPYKKYVFVLSTTLRQVPIELEEKVSILNGSLYEVLNTIQERGYQNLYIDGGKTIQSFLKEDLIDEIILTTIPIVLGGGFSLFGDLDNPLNFELIDTKVYLNQLVQTHYKRKK